MGEFATRSGGDARSIALEAAYAAGFTKSDIKDMETLRALMDRCCMSCGRILKTGEVKIIPPRYLQDRDPCVREGLVSRRIMCVSCYNKMRSLDVRKTTYSRVSTGERGSLGRSLVTNFITG